MLSSAVFAAVLASPAAAPLAGKVWLRGSRSVDCSEGMRRLLVCTSSGAGDEKLAWHEGLLG